MLEQARAVGSFGQRLLQIGPDRTLGPHAGSGIQFSSRTILNLCSGQWGRILPIGGQNFALLRFRRRQLDCPGGGISNINDDRSPAAGSVTQLGRTRNAEKQGLLGFVW